MFGIVSQRSRERNFYAAGVEEVSMRSFASAIDKPMFFQIGDELPNLTRHKTLSSKSETSKQFQSNSERKFQVKEYEGESTLNCLSAVAVGGGGSASFLFVYDFDLL